MFSFKTINLVDNSDVDFVHHTGSNQKHGSDSDRWVKKQLHKNVSNYLKTLYFNYTQLINNKYL